MNNKTMQINRLNLLRRIILIFFLIAIPVSLIYIFWIAPYHQSITVTFDNGVSYVKRSEYSNINDLPGFEVRLNHYTYQVNKDYDSTNTTNGRRTYKGRISIFKTAENPISYTYASVSIVLKAEHEKNGEPIAKYDISSLLLEKHDAVESQYTNFTIEYHTELPIKKLFKTVNHPTMYIRIRFTDKASGSLQTDSYTDYYVKLFESPSL